MYLSPDSKHELRMGPVRFGDDLVLTEAALLERRRSEPHHLGPLHATVSTGSTRARYAHISSLHVPLPLLGVLCSGVRLLSTPQTQRAFCFPD